MVLPKIWHLCQFSVTVYLCITESLTTVYITSISDRYPSPLANFVNFWETPLPGLPLESWHDWEHSLTTYIFRNRFFFLSEHSSSAEIKWLKDVTVNKNHIIAWNKLLKNWDFTTCHALLNNAIISRCMIFYNFCNLTWHKYWPVVQRWEYQQKSYNLNRIILYFLLFFSFRLRISGSKKKDLKQNFTGKI